MYKSLLVTFFVLLSFSAFSQDYASMKLNDASTNLISGTLVQNIPIQITGYSAMALSNWTYSASGLTASNDAAGMYNLKYSLSFKASVGTWTIIVKKNGTAVSKITGKRKIGSSTDIGNVAGTCLIDILVGDVITIFASSGVDATELTPIHSQLTLVPVSSGISPIIGEMIIHDNITTQTIGTGWSELENFEEAGLNEITYVLNALTLPSDGAGDYMVVFSASFSGSTAADYSFGLSVNGADPSAMQMQRNISGGQDRGNAMFCGIISLANSDVLTIKTKAAAASEVLTVTHGNLSVYSLDGATASKYGEMYMSDNSTALTMDGNDVWTQEPNFSSGSISSWTHSGGNLTVGISGKGDYFLSFSAAITYVDTDQADDTYVYVEAGIFVNGVLQNNLLFERKLQKKDNEDYGSLAGAGFLTLYDSDVVSLQYREEASKGMKTLDANINLIQLSTENVLPIELISFSGKHDDDIVRLDWQTASEINNDYFTIERSSDAKKWEAIELIAGFGNSLSTIDYTTIDASPLKNQSYYRLKQTDFDGKYSYSKIIALNDNNNESSITIYYNSQLKQLTVQSLTYELPDVYVYSSAGILMNSNARKVSSDINQEIFDLTQLSSGLYVVKVGQHTKKFVVL
jgi:hypothetical protein